MATAGSIVVDLVMKTGMFETDAKRAAKVLKDFENEAKKVGAIIGGAIATAATVMTVMVKSAIDNADALSKMAQSVGIATEELSALAYAADLSGVSQENLGASLAKLSRGMSDASRGMGDAGKAFDALGLSVKNSDGTLKTSSEMLKEIAGRFAAYRDSAEKTALAISIFGKSGAAMIPLLNSGADGIAEMEEEARRLGITLDTETGKAAEEFNDNLSRLNTKVKGLANELMKELLPSLVNVTNEFVDATTKGEQFSSFVRGLAVVAKVGATAVLGIAGAFKLLGDQIGAAAAVFMAFVNRDFELVISIQKDAVSSFKSTMDSISGAFDSIWSEAASGSRDNADSIGDAIAAPAIAGASKASSAAKDIARAQENMLRLQQQWERELSATGNQIVDSYQRRIDLITDKIKEFTEIGVPADKIKSFTDEMNRLADAMRANDVAKYLEEFTDETDAMNASMGHGTQATYEYEKAVRDLNRQMQDGILTAEAYNMRMDALARRRDSAPVGVLGELSLEIEALGKSAEWIATRNALLRAGVDAESDFGRQIAETVGVLYEQGRAIEDQISVMDGLRESTKGFFEDLRSGVGIWDAITNAASRFADRISSIVESRIIEDLFGKMGTKDGGSAGGWFSNILGSIFKSGGGRASGGPTKRGTFYEVNERGPELYNYRGRTYLMSGDQDGYVTPLEQSPAALSGGGGVSVTNAFYYRAPPDPRTQIQTASRTAFEISRARRITG